MVELHCDLFNDLIILFLYFEYNYIDLFVENGYFKTLKEDEYLLFLYLLEKSYSLSIVQFFLSDATYGINKLEYL